MKGIVYTNIGFEPAQYRMLKHIAVEEGRPMAELIRLLADQFIAAFKARHEGRLEDDFFFRMGKSWKVGNLRAARRVSEHDRVIYGL